MKEFFILLHDFNRNTIDKHDIMHYLVHTYNDCKRDGNWWPCVDSFKSPETFEEFKIFVKCASMHMYWARCQYEWLMLHWPPGNTDTLEDCQKYLDTAIKVDAYEQVKMNLDVITSIFMENVK